MNTMDIKDNKLEMQLMDITDWQKENALAFKEAFLALNQNAKKSERYFKIPTTIKQQNIKFMFHAEILTMHNNVRLNRQIKYKWNDIKAPSKNTTLFEDFEIYSNNFGDDRIEYDKCWSLYAVYSEFYESFTFSLKLLKLPPNIKRVNIKCCLNVNDDACHETKCVDLTNNVVSWDSLRFDAESIDQNNIRVSIEIIQAFELKLIEIEEREWNKYSIF